MVLRAIESGGWSHSVTQSDPLPFRISISNGIESENLAVYIWNVGHGGATRSANEYRIQLKGHQLVTEDGVKTLLLGWFEAGRVFVGFDAFKHRRFGGRSPSVQVPKPTVEEAARDGLAFHTKTLRRVIGKEVVVAFRPSLLVQYINEIFPEYHSPSAEGISVEESHVLEGNPLDRPLPTDALDHLPPNRRTAVVTINKKLREASFGENVWRIYEGRCAVCGLQAGLTEAAHIVPVKDEGIDDLRNGVQLCRNHHKAYDNGLFAIGPDYTLILNKAEVDRLTRARLTNGLDDFVTSLKVGRRISLPADPGFNPLPKHLAEGCRLRGINI